MFGAPEFGIKRAFNASIAQGNAVNLSLPDDAMDKGAV